MTSQNQIIWLNYSPALRRFDKPLLRHLSKNRSILQWDYFQTADEPSSLEVGLGLLENFLQTFTEPVHLMGHSTSGLLALLYAKKYPAQVKSLSLLSVGAYPALDWQAYYYSQMDFLRYSRYFLLCRIANHLIECRSIRQTRTMVNILEEDLSCSISPHSLYRRLVILPNTVSVPLFVATGADDVVVNADLFSGWNQWHKEGDRLWLCPKGKYFFHYEYPESVAMHLEDFWFSTLNRTTEESRNALIC